nr:MAG TPA: hypothetical protein [Inoviridae sp.]
MQHICKNGQGRAAFILTLTVFENMLNVSIYSE